MRVRGVEVVLRDGGERAWEGEGRWGVQKSVQADTKKEREKKLSESGWGM